MDLRSARLELKELVWDDLDVIHELNSFPEVDEFNTLGIPKSLDDTRESMAPAIEDKSNSPRTKYAWGLWFENQLAGKAGMNVMPQKYRRAEIYYVLNPKFWGRGIATEAAKTLVSFGFNELNLHRIEAGVATENIASINVLEKLGMTREGVGRKILPIRGKWVDNYAYSIIEDDPRDF